MKVNVSITKAVKPLDSPILIKTLLYDFMKWTPKSGQVKCFVITYEEATLYMVVQEKDENTYTNFFETYKGMKSLYDVLTKEVKQ